MDQDETSIWSRFDFALHYSHIQGLLELLVSKAKFYLCHNTKTAKAGPGFDEIPKNYENIQNNNFLKTLLIRISP